jgi:hypothetical protein
MRIRDGTETKTTKKTYCSDNFSGHDHGHASAGADPAMSIDDT